MNICILTGMKKDIYVFRHGETDYNKEGRLLGMIDHPLNATGLAQAKALADRLKDVSMELIFSSPLKRAYQTGEAVATSKNIPIVVDDRLREMTVGQMDGQLANDVATTYPEDYKTFLAWDDLDFRFPNGESNREVQARALSFFKDMAQNSYTRIGVATHSAFMRCMLLALGLPKIVEIANGAVFHIVYEDGQFTMNPLDER